MSESPAQGLCMCVLSSWTGDGPRMHTVQSSPL